MFQSTSVSQQHGSSVNMVNVSCSNMDPEFYLCSKLIREHHLGNSLLGTFSAAFTERFTGLGVSAGSRGWGTFCSVCLYMGIISPRWSFTLVFHTCSVNAMKKQHPMLPWTLCSICFSHPFVHLGHTPPCWVDAVGGGSGGVVGVF